MTIKKQSPKGKAAPVKKVVAKKAVKAIKPTPKPAVKWVVPKAVTAAVKAAPAKDRSETLTPKQEAFCVAYLSTGNASMAYVEAYKPPTMKPESIRVEAARMLVNPNIALRIRGFRAQSAEMALMTSADVLKEAMRLARFDIRKLYKLDGSPIPIHELDDETAAAIQAVDVLEEFRGSGEDRVFVGYTKKYKVADKNAALDKLFKHFGLYEVDNSQKISPVLAMLKEIGGKSALGVVKDPVDD